MTREGAALYVGIGPTMSHYEIDVANYSLVKRGELLLPNNIQYGWPHPELPVLYLSCGVGAGVNDAGDWACALLLDPETGAPSLLGVPTPISSRALHLTTDGAGEHLVLAHTRPAGISVFRTDSSGAILGKVDQRPDLDVGIFPHQVRVTPDNRFCICVSRGTPSPHEWKASTEPQTNPGSVTVFDYEDGRLKDSRTIVLDDGYHFGPRNLDFHPPRPWVYLALETQNQLVVFGLDDDGRVIPTPLQRISTLVHPETEIHQGLGPILVHPQREVLYVANRAYQPHPSTRRIIDEAAENSIVVYAIDSENGLLTEIQRISSGGACPRTLSLDPTGRMLVVANSETYGVQQANEVQELQMNLSTFRVLDDGRLEFGNRYLTGDGTGPEIAWSGIATY